MIDGGCPCLRRALNPYSAKVNIPGWSTRINAVQLGRGGGCQGSGLMMSMLVVAL
jgi:hypothetical protein